MKLSHFQQLVVQEASNIKKHATAEQLSRLDAGLIFGNDSTTCIYGLMTGSCFSVEAVDLLNKCAIPFSTCNLQISSNRLSEDFSAVGVRDFSPIEVCITIAPNSIVPIVDFIKGKTANLEMEFDWFDHYNDHDVITYITEE